MVPTGPASLFRLVVLRERNPRRMSKSVYRLRYQDLVERDGEKCAICGKTGGLEIDHVDGDPEHNRLANLRLLCKSCNVKEEHRLIRGGVGREREVVAEREISYESKVNLETEKLYRAWVLGNLARGAFSWHSLVYDGAELFKLSPTTTQRYLEKLTSNPGPAETFEDEYEGRTVLMVRLKPGKA